MLYEVITKFEYVETYYGRCYEQAFILGAVAGSLSNKPQFAFLTSRMLPSALMSLNAFALGVKMIKDDAKVRLITRESTLDDEDKYNKIIEEEMKKLDCDVCYNTSFSSDNFV